RAAPDARARTRSGARSGGGRGMIRALLLLALVTQAPGDPEAAWRAGRFAEARALYLARLEDADAADPALLYALGNCAYRLDEPAEAVLWYRRAMHHRPWDARIRDNLRLAERRLGIAEPGGVALLAALTERTALLAAAVLQAVGLCGVVLVRRRGVRAACAGVALLGLTAIVTLAWRRFAPAPAGAVVLAPALPVH